MRPQLITALSEGRDGTATPGVRGRFLRIRANPSPTTSRSPLSRHRAAIGGGQLSTWQQFGLAVANRPLEFLGQLYVTENVWAAKLQALPHIERLTERGVIRPGAGIQGHCQPTDWLGRGLPANQGKKYSTQRQWICWTTTFGGSFSRLTQALVLFSLQVSPFHAKFLS